MNSFIKNFKSSKFVNAIGINRIMLIFVILLLCIIFQVLSAVLNHGTSFVTYARLTSAVNYGYFIGFLALGVTFVIATGGIDFSIGPVMFTTALITGYLFTSYGVPMWITILLCPIVGMMFGCLNGALVAYFHLPSFITSLGVMLLAKGIGSIFTKTQNVSWPGRNDEGGWFRYLSNIEITLENGNKLNIPTGMILLIIAAIICSIVLNKTKAGRYLMCIGSNKEAVRLSGVDTRRWEMLAYIICGALAGIAAIFYVGCYTTVQPVKGDTFNNEAIAACVMGGTSMAGGTASILGTLIGTLLIAILQEGILAMGFNISFQYALTGLILIGAVAADILSRRSEGAINIGNIKLTKSK